MKRLLLFIVVLCLSTGKPALAQLKEGEVYSLGISITESDRGHPIIQRIHTGGGAWDNGGLKKGDEIILIGLSKQITGRGTLTKTIQEEARASRGAISVIIRRDGKLKGRAVWTKAVDHTESPHDYRDITPDSAISEFVFLTHAVGRAMGNPAMHPQGDPNDAKNMRRAAKMLYALTDAGDDIDTARIPKDLAKKYKAWIGLFNSLADYFYKAPRLDERHQVRMNALSEDMDEASSEFRELVLKYIDEDEKKNSQN